jgi:hypothetical protein
MLKSDRWIRSQLFAIAAELKGGPQTTTGQED